MSKTKKKLDIVSMKDFSKQSILEILELAKIMEINSYPSLLEDKIISIVFIEASTRTRLSFCSAAQRLGAKLINFDAPIGTSLNKGETLADTVRMLDYYSDLIVLRHFFDGAARFVSNISKKPVINAGDGTNQHPTQTLLDLYSIQKKRKTLEGLKIGFVGDLKYGRTVHSLSEALALFGAEMYFISPESLKLPDYLFNNLQNKGIKSFQLDQYEDILPELDVLYMTRIQKERFIDEMDYEKVKGSYIIQAKDLDGKCKKELMILHPLPRVDEIAVDVDKTSHAYYFQQAENGIFVREALLVKCFEKEGDCL